MHIMEIDAERSYTICLKREESGWQKRYQRQMKKVIKI